MATNYTNFTYDPLRQGFDSSVWRKTAGTPTVLNQLVLSAAGAIHAADILRGHFTFSVNVPNMPKAGDVSSWGLVSISNGAYIKFNINGATFSATTSDGTNTTSSTINWDPSWSDTNVDYAIRWEAGTAKFFINGGQVASTTDDSVPNSTLGLYVSNTLSTDLTVKYIICKGIQTYILIQDVITSAADIALPVHVAQPQIAVNDSVAVSEAVTIITTSYSSVNDSVTVSESVNVSLSLPSPILDSVTVSENVALTIV